MNTRHNDTKDLFFFIPHTHWEGAVFQTRAAYLDLGLPHILQALRLLKRHPNYRFTLDQVCYVRPFLERYPEEAATFRQFVEEGRLAIVGGTDSMLDVNMPGGESFVRQVLYGKRYFREALGVDVTVGWQLDTFGHHAQMPQLLKLAGCESLWFFRGVESWGVPAEFQWEGLDGSQIPAFWLPHGYAVTYGSPKTLPEFRQFFEERFERLAPFARGPGRVGLAGADVCEPEDHVPELVEQFNAQSDAPFELRIATPTDYEEFVAQRAERPVVTGELNPIFQGIYSSRIELKQRTRELEGLLTTAEKFGAMLRWLGVETDSENVWRAWEPMLFNQAHDLMSGVMTDRVWDDSIRGFDFSKRLAEEEVKGRLQRYASRINTRGNGIPVVVVNTLSWPRTDVASVTVGFSDAGIHGVKVIGPYGNEAPTQIVDAKREEDGALILAEVAFLAEDVPPLGHCVYHLIPLGAKEATETVSSQEVDSAVLENEHLHVEVDATGQITRLLDKSNAWEVLNSAGNVVAREEDHGDLWELYRPLDGGSRLAMTEKHGVPQAGEAAFSSEQAAETGRLTMGPVFSQFEVEHAFGGEGHFATTVRVCAGLRRVEIRTRILNNDEFVRYRVLFPTSIEDGRSMHEIPFGAMERPTGIEFPAQNWVDYGDGKRGIALLNRGVPGNNVADGTLMLSLCRSTRIVAYGFGGGYEPGMSSDSGFELGKEHTFDYALAPHAGAWREAATWRDGMEFNNPLIARTSASHEGTLPRRRAFVEVSHPNVVVSTLKPGEEGNVVMRVYEAAGQPTQDVTLTFAAPVVSAEEVNLIEDPTGGVEITGNAVRLDLDPFEITTVRLQLQPPARAS